jgi:hypothetical protein
VLVHEAARAKIKRDRVSDLLEINSHEASFQLRKQFKNNIEDLRNVKNEAGLLLAIQGASGARKGEVYDPNIKFYTWHNYVRLQTKKDEWIGTFHIGNQDNENDEDDLDPEEYESAFGSFDHLLVQVGVAKDVGEALNSILRGQAGTDHLLVSARVIIKPTCVLTAREIVMGVKAIRKRNGITVANYKGRKSTYLPSTATKEVLREMFAEVMKKSDKSRYQTNTHLMRALYAHLSFYLYEETVYRSTGKHQNFGIWANELLGHDQHSPGASDAYNKIVLVHTSKQAELTSTTREDIIDMKQRIEFLEISNRVLETTIKDILARLEEKDFRHADLEEGEIRESDYVSLTNLDNEQVNIKKLPKLRKGATDAEKKERFLEVKKLMAYNRVNPTQDNMRIIGTIGKRFFKEAKPPIEEAFVLAPKRKRVELPEGTKIIRKKGKNAKSTAVMQTEDNERFGEENMLDKAADCKGTIEKQQKVGKVIRDICNENLK